MDKIILPPSVNVGNSSVCNSKSLCFGSPWKIDAHTNFLAFTMIFRSNKTTLDWFLKSNIQNLSEQKIRHSFEAYELKHEMTIVKQHQHKDSGKTYVFDRWLFLIFLLTLKCRL